MKLNEIKQLLIFEEKNTTIKDIKIELEELDRIFSTRELFLDVSTQKRIDSIYKEVAQFKKDMLDNIEKEENKKFNTLKERLNGNTPIAPEDILNKTIYLINEVKNKINKEKIVIDVELQKSLSNLYNSASKLLNSI